MSASDHEDVASLHLADAKIVQVIDNDGSLQVVYLDWQDQLRSVLFTGVLGYLSFCPEGRELSHATVSTDDALIGEAARRSDEGSSEGFRLFGFVGAWNNERVLEIVAKEARARPAPPTQLKS